MTLSLFMYITEQMIFVHQNNCKKENALLFAAIKKNTLFATYYRQIICHSVVVHRKLTKSWHWQTIRKKRRKRNR